MSVEQITTHLLLLIRRIALNQKCVRLHGFFGKGNIAGQTFVAVQIKHGYVVLGRAECDLRILIGEREAVCKGFLGDGLMIVIEQQEAPISSMNIGRRKSSTSAYSGCIS